MSKFDERSRILTVLFAIASLLVTIFILYQSTRTIVESSAISGKFSAVIQSIIDPDYRIPQKMFHHFVRKAAHFAEFSALGFFVGGFTVNQIGRAHV